MKKSSAESHFRLMVWIPLLSVALPMLMGCEHEEVFHVAAVQWGNAEEGEEDWITLNLFGIQFSPEEDGGPALLPIRVGDEVFVSSEGDGASVPILRSDGDVLEFGSGEGTVTLNGSSVALGLSEDTGWEWLGQAGPEDKAGLRVVYLMDGVTPEQLALLEDLAAVNPSVDLATDRMEALPRLLDLFDPEGLHFGAPISGEIEGLITREPALKRLTFSSSDVSNLTFLSQLTSLEKLALYEWDLNEIGPLPDSLGNLRSIFLSEPDLEDLEALGHQPGLEELILFGCSGDEESGQLNLEALSRHLELELASFRFCEVSDFSPLEEIEDLRWLTLPPSTTQGQLEQVVRSHPKLSVLEFIEAEEITDLTPLNELEKLRALIVGSAAPPDPLYAMDHLEYLAVVVEENDSTAFTPEVFTRLQTVLPETVVTRVEPFCLGSGFILLLIPLVGGATWMARRRRRARRPVLHNG